MRAALVYTTVDPVHPALSRATPSSFTVNFSYQSTGFLYIGGHHPKPSASTLNFPHNVHRHMDNYVVFLLSKPTVFTNRHTSKWLFHTLSRPSSSQFFGAHRYEHFGLFRVFVPRFKRLPLVCNTCDAAAKNYPFLPRWLCVTSHHVTS